jgi:thymidylate kinase
MDWGISRLLVGWVRFWWAYVTTILPARSRGYLVVGDRWIYGYVVAPESLRYFGPAALARLAVKLAPQPDLVANLVAPLEIVRDRKRELQPDEILRQMTVWESVPARRLFTVEATAKPEAIASRIIQEIDYDGAT